MNSDVQLTASVVSHGQMRLVNTLIADLIRHAGPPLKRLVVTLNVPQAEVLRADGAPFEVITLRNDRALGFGANHNRAFRHCNTDWFVVLNPDLRLSDDALGSLLAACEPQDGPGRPADSERRRHLRPMRPGGFRPRCRSSRAGWAGNGLAPTPISIGWRACACC